MIHKSRYTILSSIHLYFSSFPSVCRSLISRIKCYSKTHKFTSIWYGVFKIKFWKCRVSAACFVNLPPKRNVRGTLPSHVVSPGLKEVFSRLCCLFLRKRSHLFCCTECFWYPDTCSGRERLLHWAAHFQMRCCSCATCKSTEQLNYSVAKFTGMIEDELAWQDGAKRGSSWGSSYHDGCELLGVEDQKAGSFLSQTGSVLGLLALLQPCFKIPHLYFPIVSHLYRGCSAHGDPEAGVTFPHLDVFSPHRTAFHPLECSPQALPAGIAAKELECGLCSLPCSKPKEMEPFGCWSSKAHLGSQLGESPSKPVPSISLFFQLCPQGCCSPSCQGFGSVAGKMMWSLADFLILAFWLWLWGGWTLKWERQWASVACDLVRNSSACR